MFKKKKNYKLLIGFILGIILFGGIVYASINYSANVFLYDNSTSTLNSNNVQGAIHELAQKYATVTVCPSNKVCIQKKNTLALGDYVSYTPTSTNYVVDQTKTGYSYQQIINPSELNLWRVISINNNDTVDIISEYVSSSTIYFTGLTGYQNLVGYLNVLASQYETSGVTVGSRNIGYSNQTEYINMQYLGSSSPWACTTNGTSGDCSPDPDDYEAYGGGDRAFYADYNLIKNLNLTATVTNSSGSPSNFMLSTRSFYYYNANFYNLNTNTVGQNSVVWTSTCYEYNSGTIRSYGCGAAIRPIVTLSSSHTYSGIGTKEYPMEIIS